ncbi:MAG: deoxyribonuclease IV [Planctomycetes bacterium]|nr:deoxyribonuclease IV [Planctomycetota bacterium]
MALLGAHCTTAGGLPAAAVEARDLRCEAIQVFLKSNRQWAMRDLAEGEAAAFARDVAAAGVKRAVAHGTYLVNLAAVDAAVARKSLDTFTAEARRAEEVGIESLVFHPGAHMGAGEEAGFAKVAAGLRHALRETRGAKVLLLLENAAGQGTTLGTRFEDLARMMEIAGDDPRLGICLDTCHAFAAGHDLSTDGGYDAVMADIDRTVGLARLRAVHLNDSRLGLGSRRDRHENLGKGVLGRTVFRRLVNDPRLAEVPMVLETPGGLEGYRDDLRILRRLRKRENR